MPCRHWEVSDLSADREIILEAKHVTRRFRASGKKQLTACNDINLRLFKGETLGLVGESGCGKTTFVKLLVSLDKPDEGGIVYRGQDITALKGEKLRMIRQHIQMVFQDPALSFNPKMKIRDIICEPLLNFRRIKPAQKDRKAKELLEMVELPPDMSDRYMHNMSGGERQRVAIARAIALEPELVIMDEATSALDVSVQKNIMELIVRLQREKNITICFICHDIALIASIAHRIAVMYLGNIVELLPGNDIAAGAKHPYTRSLIDSVFDIKMDFSEKIKVLEGEPPSPLDAPEGCPFCDRCEYCMEICRKEKPGMRAVGKEHFAACHLHSDMDGSHDI